MNQGAQDSSPVAARHIDRLAAMAPSVIRQLHDEWKALQRERPNQSWIPLHFGEPDLGTPDFIIEAGCDALRSGAVFYEDNSGRADLKQSLADHYRSHYSVRLSPEHFVITCGGTQAIVLVMLAMLSEGDEVINVTPAWPNFAQAARIAGATVHELPLVFDADTKKFIFNFDALKELVDRLDQLRMIVVNTPSNPTGWVMPSVDKQQLATFCRERDLCLLGDEIYDRIVFAGEAPPTFLRWQQDSDRLLVINGFSKSYAMTGWRVGFLVGDPKLLAKMARMQEFITSHAPSMAQVAAITALRAGEPFLTKSLSRYRKLRDLVVDRVAQLPAAQIIRPDGAIYVFFRVPGAMQSVTFCRKLMSETGVLLAPGAAFGSGGEGWLRLCFANDAEVLDDAVGRISDFLART